MSHSTPNTQQQDIAIIGMGCMFPGAPNLDAFWQNIISKVDAITDPPPEAWDSDVFYDPDSAENDRVYCKRGGYLGPIAHFDPLAHGVMPRAAEGGEPDQWLALQVARAALTDAGYPEGPENGHQTAVILGKGTYINRGNLTMVQHSLMVEQTLQVVKSLHSEFTEEELALIRQELKQNLPLFNAEAASAMVPNIVAGRIANRLDLMGPTYTVDAACASSLVAVDLAVQNLRSGECNLALAGGVQVTTPIPILTLFSQLKALSLQEKIRPFDINADGTILGEGLGMVVLKRREDAEHDGDRIYAVIKGVGVASDGRGMSVLAPRLEGEELALRRAYEAAAVSPHTVGLIEAHGTATLVGDAAEIQALTRVFGERNGALPWCALGTVKSMIGHAMPAAGVAGLIKAALALYHKILPPTLNVDQPSPRLELDKTPFYINTESRPWIHGSTAAPRRAGVNAFGFGGINAHVILEEVPFPDETRAPSHLLHWETEVFLLRGESRSAVMQQAQQLHQFLESDPDVTLKDLAYSLNVTRVEPPSQNSRTLAIVASSFSDFSKKLAWALQRLEDAEVRHIKAANGVYYFEQPLGHTGKLAFIFPGEGAQYSNMLADLCWHFPEVRRCFDLVDRAFLEHPRGRLPSDDIFPRPTFSKNEREAAEKSLWELDRAVESVLTANQALYVLLDRLALRPDAVVGHSSGEFSALRAAGVLALSDETKFVEFSRGLNQTYEEVASTNRIPRAALIAVGADVDTVAASIRRLNGHLHIAMANCPHQTVVVGDPDVAREAAEAMQSQGLILEVLPFDRAYHTPEFKPYTERLQRFFADVPLQTPQLPIYSCATAAPFPDDVENVRALVVEQWERPVLFQKTIEAMYADGVRLFVEVGPRGNLSAFVDDILRGQPYLTVPSNVMRRSGITQLNHLVGLLAAHGVSMQLAPLYAPRAPQTLDLGNVSDPAGTEKHKSSVIKLATGWPPMSISAETATRLRERWQVSRTESDHSWQTEPAQPTPPAQPERAEASNAMSSYFQTMERFLAVQQDVMEAYLRGNVRGEAPVDPHARTDVAAPANVEQQSAPAEPEPASMAETDAMADQATPPPQREAPAAAPPEQESIAHKEEQALDLAGIAQTLLRIVSAKTGYPSEMLDLKLDLEADLGIDSIKRVEILGSFQQETGLRLGDYMDQMAARRSLQEIVDYLDDQVGVGTESATASATGERANSQETNTPPFPFVGRVIKFAPGEELIAECEVSLEAFPFLRDHTLGRDVSALDAYATALPVMPLTMTMEMLAEAGAMLAPDRVLTAMRRVRAYRWIALETPCITLRLTASRASEGEEGQIDVKVYQLADDEAEPSLLAEGGMVFGSSYPAARTVPPVTLQQERPSQFAPEQLYTDGMFHGQQFRAVAQMLRCAADGTVGTLRVLPWDRLFSSTSSPHLLTDPVILDAAGQVIGLWAMEWFKKGRFVFPSYVESVEFYDGPRPVGEHITCQARIQILNDRQIRSDIDLINSEGQLWMRLVGWEDRRFDGSMDFFRFSLSPRDVVLSTPWSTPCRHFAAPDGSDTLICVQIQDLFTSDRNFWHWVWSYLVLTPQEMEEFRRLRTPDARRAEWLLGRVAAKDAVRTLLQCEGITVCPADIEIVNDDNGRPIVQGEWTNTTGRAPTVTITHTSGRAAAMVGWPSHLGLDMQELRARPAGFDELAFTTAEREWLQERESALRDEWAMRLWCAKEAAAKALGAGMIEGPQHLPVQVVDARQGIVRVRLTGKLASHFPNIAASGLLSYTAREGDYIVASTYGEIERKHVEKS